MNNEREQASVYAVSPSEVVTKVNPPKGLQGKVAGGMDEAAKPDERYEKTILKALYKYGFLTLNLITRIGEGYGLRRPGIEAALKRLLISEKAERYTVDDFSRMAVQKDFYLLSRGERTAMKESEPTRPVYKFDVTNLAYVMRNMMAVQWHISLLEHKGKEVMFNGRVELKEKRGMPIEVPSLVRVRAKRNEKIAICAVAAPKGQRQRDTGKFVMNVVELFSYFASKANAYPRFAIVILCESEAQMKDVALLFKSIDETANGGIPLLYARVDATRREKRSPLSALYLVDREKGYTDISLIDLAK